VLVELTAMAEGEGGGRLGKARLAMASEEDP